MHPLVLAITTPEQYAQLSERSVNAAVSPDTGLMILSGLLILWLVISVIRFFLNMGIKIAKALPLLFVAGLVSMAFLT
ncbi:hypothetical protein ACN08Y_10675 [Rothia sp. P5764]|uniref:hypothetical protein n=1 Tax=Rothia sp. P5764 TaxID=3402654 RepID=UPI003AD1DE89